MSSVFLILTAVFVAAVLLGVLPAPKNRRDEDRFWR
jgi:hypothetical protein